MTMPAKRRSAPIEEGEVEELQAPAYLEPPVRTSRSEVVLGSLAGAGIFALMAGFALSQFIVAAAGMGLLVVGLVGGAIRRFLLVGGFWGAGHHGGGWHWRG
jgi:hypothetical protein